MLEPKIKNIFQEWNIPEPSQLVSADQNPVDFNLLDNKTLSVKTNQKALGKVAPQVIGQPTRETFFAYFKDMIDEPIPKGRKAQNQFFKKWSLENIDKLIPEYWANLFNCDFTIHFYNFLNSENMLMTNTKYLVINKPSNNISWNKDDFSFTQTYESWNESNTVKYHNISLGEFQVHNNRNCLKFRFNLKGIKRLIHEGLI